MNVAWCVMALALTGTDEPRTSEPAVCAARPMSAESQEIWPMSLSAATRIALDNSKLLRVVTECVPSLPVGGLEPARVDAAESDADNRLIVIARANADESIWRFQSDVMALVRLVEQQYWNLAQAHAALSSSEQALKMTQGVLGRELSELTIGRACSRGIVEHLTDVARRLSLEKMNIDVVRKTSDLITSERQLRTILGLPLADNRRIVPTTKPTEEQVVFDWDTCLSDMMEEQPDIRQQQAVVRLAELHLLLARNQFIPYLDKWSVQQLIDLGPELECPQQVVLTRFRQSMRPLVYKKLSGYLGLGANQEDYRNFLTWQVGLMYPLTGMHAPLSNTRQAQYVLLRSRAFEHQVVKQTTHSLASFFLEIDADYKQFTTAQRQRSAAQMRLDAQRAYYDEGRITIDRFVDAISAYAAAVTLESQHNVTYNISLAAMFEANGTLLSDRNIVIAESAQASRRMRAVNAMIDEQIRTTSCDPARTEPALNTSPDTKPKKCTFSISIGWDKPLQIKGAISVDDHHGNGTIGNGPQ
jgi:Outer membrane efflux protein